MKAAISVARTVLFGGGAAVAIAILLVTGLASRAEARPRNPYSSFNLSGVNYGAMQWERAQRQGRRVWPYYNTPSRSYPRGAAVTGGTGGFNTRVRRSR
jgi:hypothetical protein